MELPNFSNIPTPEIKAAKEQYCSILGSVKGYDFFTDKPISDEHCALMNYTFLGKGNILAGDLQVYDENKYYFYKMKSIEPNG